MVLRKDLVGIGDDDYHDRQGEYVQCQDCGASFGGTRGDYWEYPMDHMFVCSECRSEILALVRDVVSTRIVKQ